MKKAKIFIFLVTFAISILSIGCSNKMKEWEMGIYLTDLNTNIANTVFITYDIPDQVDWAMDSKHFAVVEDVVNTEVITYLFDGVDLVLSPKETKIAYTVPKGKSMQEFNRYGTFESTDMETWIYDIQKGEATKLADFYAKVFFSPDDRYIIYYPIRYVGQPFA